jgi:hypothetical protein
VPRGGSGGDYLGVDILADSPDCGGGGSGGGGEAGAAAAALAASAFFTAPSSADISSDLCEPDA